ncbi:MAG: dienelactone hydrolase family protein [Deltaproteobacteria bacterium]
MSFRNSFRSAWAVAACLCVLFAILASLLPEPAHRIEYKRIENGLKMPLWIVIYRPGVPSFAKAPAAVICQPINDPPEYGRMLELELVRDGFVVLTFDWRGRTSAENRQLLHTHTQEAIRLDVAAAVKYLRSMPEVDPNRVMVAGHSVGGTLAVDAGLADPTIAGVVSIGMEADVSPDQPRNLLWAVGLYDEFRDLGRMRRFFYASTGRPEPEGMTIGDISKGTARRMDVSPTADHFTEMQDHSIHRSVVGWFREVAGLPPLNHAMTMEARGLFMTLAWLCALIAALAGVRHALTPRDDRVRWLRIVLGAALMAAIALRFLSGNDFLEITDAILVLCVFALLAGSVTTLDSPDFYRARRFAIRLGLVLWASLFLTLVVNNVPYFWQQPKLLAGLPEFAVRHVLDLADAYLFDYPRPLLFSVYDPQTISPRLWVYLVMVIETLFPAAILGAIARLSRVRFRTSSDRKPLSVTSLVLLVALAVFLGVVVWLRIEQGFLTGDSARAAARYLLRFTVLPFFIFAALWRATRRWSAKPRT